MNKLFVYGIFLDKANRDAYGMTHPRYTTVLNYVTIGHSIVQAVPVSSEFGCSLTGLLVDVDPNRWEDIDRLERGYDRVEIVTTNNERAYMYVRRLRNGQE